MSENLSGKIYNITHANEEDTKIVSPRLMQPTIKLKGESFIITIKAADYACDWEAKISTQYRETSLVLENVGYELDSGLWSLEVSIPDETAEDLYDLKVALTVSDATQTLIEYNAVQVLEEYPESFTIIQMNDAKIIPGATAIVEKQIQAFLQANLINPAFILFDGDLVQTGTITQLQYFKTLCRNLQVPIFALAGNHELSSGTTNYADEIGQLYYSLEYGNAFFIMACTWADGYLDPTQFEWIDNQLADHKDSALKVITMHFPVWQVGTWDYYITEAEEFIEICQKHSVDLVLYAKSHTDDARIVDGTIYLMTTAVAAEVWAGKENGYRVINIQDYDVIEYSYNGENLSQPLAGIQVERVPEDIRVSDKGLRLKITNQLSHSLENLRIKAVFEPLTNDEYLIFNATPISIVKSSNSWLITAICNVPVASSIEVVIYPSNPSAPNIADISYPSQVEDSKSFIVEATIENDVSGVESVDLFYTLDDLEQLHRKSIEYSETDSYSIRVPAQPSGTKSLKFYIVARDFSGLETTSETYIVIIGSEEEPSLGIPGFPIEGIILGVVLSVITITMIRKKEKFFPFQIRA